MKYFRPKVDETDPDEYAPLLMAIEEFNMQGHVQELGRDWCAYVFKIAPDSLWKVLEICSMLTSEPGREWYEAAFGSDPEVLKYVLRDVGF
jgi:hypothetical protein